MWKDWKGNEMCLKWINFKFMDAKRWYIYVKISTMICLYLILYIFNKKKYYPHGKDFCVYLNYLDRLIYKQDYL